MLEIYFKTVNETIRLPVTPINIGVGRTVNIGRENLLLIGEIPHFNGSNLKTVSLSSFFPKQNYPFAYNTNLKTYDLANKFIRWQKNGQQLRLVVTEADINMIVLIEKFDTREQDGSGDLYFDMELIEYKEPKPKKLTNDELIRLNDNEVLKDNSEKKKQKTYIVKKGDTIIDIAKSNYGNTDFSKIIEANKSKYPNLSKSNKLEVGWEIILP